MACGQRRYTMCTSCAPSSLDCTAASTAVMPPPITTTWRPMGRLPGLSAWRSVAMKSTASCTPCKRLTRHAKLVRVGQTHAQKQGIKVVLQCIKLADGFELPAMCALDAANAQQPLHFSLRKVIGRLVAGQAIFVEAASLGLGIKDHHAGGPGGQRVGAGQPRRAGAHHCHFFAADGATGTLKYLRLGTVHQRVHRMALQAANCHRAVFLGVAHTDRLTQVFGGANPGAHAAQGVGLQDGRGPSRADCRQQCGG
jgi:hypothetical protein